MKLVDFYNMVFVSRVQISAIHVPHSHSVKLVKIRIKFNLILDNVVQFKIIVWNVLNQNKSNVPNVQLEDFYKMVFA